MNELLPRLRTDIDVMPSPVAEQPGLLLRDPFRFTEDVLVIPPLWVAMLQCLDGEHHLRDAQAVMSRRLEGEIVPADAIRRFVSALTEAGYVMGDALESRKASVTQAFRDQPLRQASHAGAAYPGERDALDQELSSALGPDDAVASWPMALAAPHVSPHGGYPSYRAGYDLPPLTEDKTFVILGTSHYGEPERFGVTAKAFETPLGTVPVDESALSMLAAHAGDALIDEDYCHRVEHSIEFQVICLQYRLKRPFRILPVLCGPFADSVMNGRAPEAVESNRRAFDAFSELSAARRDLVWVLGVDMAHIGTRYGDREAVRAYDGKMQAVQEQDAARLQCVCDLDASGLFELTHPQGDPLRWCGYAPLYTFLRAVSAVADLRGEVLSYEQWNIDQRSVVSFAALHFHGARG